MAFCYNYKGKTYTKEEFENFLSNNSLSEYNDKTWKMEVPDLEIKKESQDLLRGVYKGKIKNNLKLKDIVKTTILFEAYPKAKDIKITYNENLDSDASYNPLNNEIELAPNIVNGSELNLKTILLHEVQHYIQNEEDFSKGGNELSFMFKILEDLELPNNILKSYDFISLKNIVRRYYNKDLHPNYIGDVLNMPLKDFEEESRKIYFRLAGEVEAYNTRNRMNMSMEERAKTLLSETEDVAEEDKIYLQNTINSYTASTSNEKSSATLVAEYLKEKLNYNINILSTSEINKELEKRGYVSGMVDGQQQSFTTRNGKTIGYTSDTNQTARERFKISELTKIGQGSDRTVFKLEDNKVLKVAHTARGLEQNIYEGDNYLSNIVPNVFEEGLNYVVVEDIPRAKSKDIVTIYDADGNEIGKSTVGVMLSELSNFNQKDFDNKNSKLLETLDKYGFGDITSYEVIYLDFIALRNWGYKDGKAYHLDGGTFGGVQLLDRFRGKAPLSDPEFREIYYTSRQQKKAYGESDKYTKFLKTTDKVYGFYDPKTKQIFLTEEYLTSESLIHETFHWYKPILQEEAAKGNKQVQAILNKLKEASLEFLGGEESIKKRFNSKQKSESNVEYQIIGENNTLTQEDKTSLEEAKKLFENGAENQEVFEKTNWFKDNKGNLLREVDDLTLKEDTKENVINNLLLEGSYTDNIINLTNNRRKTKFENINIKYNVKEYEGDKVYTDGNSEGNIRNASIMVSINIPKTYTKLQKEDEIRNLFISSRQRISSENVRTSNTRSIEQVINHEYQHILQKEGLRKVGNDPKEILFYYVRKHIDILKGMSDEEGFKVLADLYEVKDFYKDFVFGIYEDSLGEKEAKLVEDRLYDKSNLPKIENAFDVDITDFLNFSAISEKGRPLQSEVYNPRPNETLEEYRSRLVEEAQATILGKNSTEYFEKISKENGLNEKQTTSFIDKIKAFIKDFSNWLIDKLGIKNVTPEMISNMTIKELSETVITSMLQGDYVSESSLNNTNQNINFMILGEKGVQNITPLLESLNKAKQLQEENINSTEIENQTGWFKENGDWKYFSKDFLADLKIQEKPFILDKEYDLEDFIKNNLILDAYPKLKNTKIVIYDGTREKNINKATTFGYTSEGNIFLNSRYANFENGLEDSRGEVRVMDETNRNNEDFRAKRNPLYVLAHELTHLIQEQENFPKGGNPNTVLQEAKEITKTKSSKLGDLRDDISLILFSQNLSKEKEGILKAAYNSLNTYFATQNEEVFYKQYQLLAGEVEASFIEYLKEKYDGEDIEYTLLKKEYENVRELQNQVVVRTVNNNEKRFQLLTQEDIDNLPGCN